jgi:hypothetical protein
MGWGQLHQANPFGNMECQESLWKHGVPPIAKLRQGTAFGNMGWGSEATH